MKTIDIVFDGPPGPTAGRFVEVEDEFGASIGVGEWIERDDGFWALRIPDHRALTAEGATLKGLLFESLGMNYLGQPMPQELVDQINSYKDSADDRQVLTITDSL